jgi:ceramide glucosyltransferase
MGVLLDAVALLSLATAAIGIAYLVFSAVAVARFRGSGIAPAPFPQRKGPPGGRIPHANALSRERDDHAVSILVPLCGAEPGLKRRLERLCDQDYQPPPQIICGVMDAEDEAAELVRTLICERPDTDIQLCIDPRVHGRNAKVSNLINMVERADHDIFFLVDSDIDAPPDLVARLAGLLRQPGVGAATCLYYGSPGDGLWARLSAAGITGHFLPDAVAGLSLKLANPCFGATIALTRGMLWRIGGLMPFADQLWDDYALGEAVRGTGSEVLIAPFALPHCCAEQSAGELLSRELRSARTIRCIAPLGYLGNVFTHPLGFALVTLIAGSVGSGIAAAILAIAARAWLCRSVSRRFGAAAVPLWLQPLRDILAFIVYLGGGFGRRIVWRGREYSVAADGALTPAGNRGEKLSGRIGRRFTAS